MTNPDPDVPPRDQPVPDLSDARRPGLRALVEGAAKVLAEAGVASPHVDARALAAAALGVDRLDLVLPPELPDEFAATYAGLVERRRLREPLQHITGTAAFRYLTLHVEPGVFVPRPETEQVAQVAIDEAVRVLAAGTGPVVVDLCCGAGGIALAVASEVPGARVLAVDASPEAVALTRRNRASVGVPDTEAVDGAASGAALASIGEPAAGLAVLLGDVRDATLLAGLEGRVDVVVSNPPYIPPDAVPVDPEVRDHDPDLALYGGGADGLDVPRAVLAAAARLLVPGGLLVMEHAEVQDAAAREAAAELGSFVEIATVPDLTGRPRSLVARRSSSPARDRHGS